MDPTDKQWDSNDDMKTWKAFMGKYMPGANTADGNYVYAYAVSHLMEQTLKNCGDDADPRQRHEAGGQLP